MPGSRKRPLIGAVMKGEEDYILEWVAWHRLQGFDLAIADNCTQGPQTKLLRALARAGLVRYLDLRRVPTSPQLVAYNRLFWFSLLNGYKHLGFLDTDEFFEPVSTEFADGAQMVVEMLNRPRVAAAGFHWCIFGSAGHLRMDDGLVVERFPMRAIETAPLHKYIKSFTNVRQLLPRAIRHPWHVVKSPHRAWVPKTRYLYDGRRESECREGTGIWSTARIRHYAVKSREEFERKRQRGDTFYARPEDKPGYHEYWSDYDLNDVYEPVDDAVIGVVRDTIEKYRKRLD